jgi:DNA-binding response OmpR family regulator
MKFLVCEDDLSILSLIEFKIKKSGLGSVIKAKDGRQAKQHLLNEEFDFVITDIHVPFLSGLEIISLIRNEMKSDIPIVVLSVEELEDTVLQAFELGADDYVVKPFNPSELILRIYRILKKQNPMPFEPGR